MCPQMLPNLSDRVRFIGRGDEIKTLKKYIAQRGETRFVCFWAAGGYGKTRLLKELYAITREMGPGFHATELIDLFYSDSHGSSDIERLIVDGLDPNNNYFKKFREARTTYELLRERGANPTELEKRRKDLSKTFVQEIREMALDVKKLVILFDTIEHLQYESSVIEQEAGLHMVDTRIRSWILNNLKDIRNAVVVFAGRPKLDNEGKPTSAQIRLQEDMRTAFGDMFEMHELLPFDLEETQKLMKELPEADLYIDAEMVPVIHALTGGRPILLHLVYDLFSQLAQEPAKIYESFKSFKHLVGRPDNDPELIEARKTIEREIINAIYQSGEVGEYLFRFALMPKGIDIDIVRDYTGLPEQQVKNLLERLSRLSFVKEHNKRLFFHEEMYRLLTDPKVIRNVRLNEVQAAHALITHYYTPRIQKLEEELLGTKDPEIRITLRSRLHMLEVERLYYMLINDAKKGYEQYKNLVTKANAQRWVGYGMRLLDEFLRFYNPEPHRDQMEAAGIKHEQIVRESAQMWVERFHWWARYSEGIEFATKILSNPELFKIDPQQHRAIMGNIVALKVRGQAMTEGFSQEALDQARAALDVLPPVPECSSDELLARGRLGTSIGFQERKGGMIDEACRDYGDALRSFRRLGTHLDECAMVLNNLLHVHSRRGQVALARIFGGEAMKLNSAGLGDYAVGLTQLNLATGERYAGANFNRALEHAQKALDIFQTLQDQYGIVRATLHMAGALRELADDRLITGEIKDAEEKLRQASSLLVQGIQEAEAAGLKSDLPELEMELGKVYRSMGRLLNTTKAGISAIESLREGEEHFKKALQYPGWPIMERADIEEDIAELYFEMGDYRGAEAKLRSIEESIMKTAGPDILVKPGRAVNGEGVPNYNLWPLGKVERLRGELAFKRGELLKGGEHLFKAYAYFDRFSENAVEKDEMLDAYYRKYLSQLNYNENHALMSYLEEWMQSNDCHLGGVDMRPLLSKLHELLVE